MASNIHWHDTDPYTALVSAVDGACMALYTHMRRNARRIMRIVLALLPIMMLLVGSCKTSQLPHAYGGNGGAEQLRTALFPDRVNAPAEGYYPARGYISRAQKYVAGTPDTLSRLTEAEVGYILGRPALTRRDAGARVWQYRAGNCVVDVYFYEDEAGPSGPGVAHVDVRINGAVEEPPPRLRSRCLKRVIARGDFSSLPA